DTATHTAEQHHGTGSDAATAHDDAAPSRPSSASGRFFLPPDEAPSRCADEPRRSAPARRRPRASVSDEDGWSDRPPTQMSGAPLAKRRRIDATTDVPSRATRSGTPRPA